MEPWEDGVGEWEGHSVTQVFIPIFKAPRLLGVSNSQSCSFRMPLEGHILSLCMWLG